MAHVEFLASEALRGRGSFSADERAAADYLVAQLETAMIAPYDGKVRWQAFSVQGKKSNNVLGEVRCDGCARPDEFIVLGAHYDHVGTRQHTIYPGAEDNASGVAAVLEIAKALQSRRRELGRSVLVVFFGAEEAGLLGSRAFVRKPPLERSRMVAMVNVDMLGHPLADRPAFELPKWALAIDDQRTVGVIGTSGRPALARLVQQGCAEAGLQAVVPDDLGPVLAAMVEHLADGRADSYSFEAVGIPALFFSSGESEDYHQPTDTPDHIVPAILAARTHGILAVVLRLSHVVTGQ